jgi:hypothetical protein
MMDNLIVGPFPWAREPDSDVAIGRLRVTVAQRMRIKHPNFVKPPLQKEVPQVRWRQRNPALPTGVAVRFRCEKALRQHAKEAPADGLYGTVAVA